MNNPRHRQAANTSNSPEKARVAPVKSPSLKRHIPHDFISKKGPRVNCVFMSCLRSVAASLSSAKCHFCSKSVTQGKLFLKCSTCEYVCHTTCLSQAPADCGGTPVKTVCFSDCECAVYDGAQAGETQPQGLSRHVK